MNGFSVAGFGLNSGRLPFWMFSPWNRYRYLPHESLYLFFATGSRTRPVKREFWIRTRTREMGGRTG